MKRKKQWDTISCTVYIVLVPFGVKHKKKKKKLFSDGIESIDSGGKRINQGKKEEWLYYCGFFVIIVGRKIITDKSF